MYVANGFPFFHAESGFPHATFMCSQQSETDTDKEWNEVSQPTEGDAANIYRSSKVQAERAAWAFVDAEGDAASFSLVTINPPMVVRHDPI